MSETELTNDMLEPQTPPKKRGKRYEYVTNPITGREEKIYRVREPWPVGACGSLRNYTDPGTGRINSFPLYCQQYEVCPKCAGRRAEQLAELAEAAYYAARARDEDLYIIETEVDSREFTVIGERIPAQDRKSFSVWEPDTNRRYTINLLTYPHHETRGGTRTPIEEAENWDMKKIESLEEIKNLPFIDWVVSIPDRGTKGKLGSGNSSNKDETTKLPKLFLTVTNSASRRINRSLHKKAAQMTKDLSPTDLESAVDAANYRTQVYADLCIELGIEVDVSWDIRYVDEKVSPDWSLEGYFFADSDREELEEYQRKLKNPH